MYTLLNMCIHICVCIGLGLIPFLLIMQPYLLIQYSKEFFHPPTYVYPLSLFVFYGIGRTYLSWIARRHP